MRCLEISSQSILCGVQKYQVSMLDIGYSIY
jgi:hypothetical protein